MFLDLGHSQEHMFPAHFFWQYKFKSTCQFKNTCFPRIWFCNIIQIQKHMSIPRRHVNPQVSRHFFASLSVRLDMPEDRRARLDSNSTVCLLVQINASKLGIDMFFWTCITFQNKMRGKSSQLASLPWLSDLCSWQRVRETAACASTACLHVC